MRCPACGAEYVAGDRFCGNCGERLPADGGGPSNSPAPPPIIVGGPAPAPSPARPGGPACPVCGTALPPEAHRCEVCGFEPGASVVLPGTAMQQSVAQASAQAPARGQADISARVCPVHGPLDPSWTRCPYCLREGREGRLASGPVGIAADQGAPQVPSPGPPPILVPPAAGPASPPVSAPSLSPASAPPPIIVGSPPEQRQEPQEPAAPAAGAYPPGPATPPPLQEMPGLASAPTAPPSAAPPPAAVPPASPPPPAPPEGGIPRSSVGATFVVRRRPRVLAYLVEREGEAVGRVHQLDDDITDIGRDPRNHLVLGDVLVSGFHARIERGPDGGFLVQDRHSTNGSFLNDEPLKDPRPFQENDQLRVGNTTLILKVVG